jgi:hypothetical protein
MMMTLAILQYLPKRMLNSTVRGYNALQETRLIKVPEKGGAQCSLLQS